MTSQEYLNRVARTSAQTTGIVNRKQDKPWGIQWDMGGVDPFTEELPITWYHTPAEAIRAAGSIHDAYSPKDYPQITEPVSVDAEASTESA